MLYYKAVNYAFVSGILFVILERNNLPVQLEHQGFIIDSSVYNTNINAILTIDFTVITVNSLIVLCYILFEMVDNNYCLKYHAICWLFVNTPTENPLQGNILTTPLITVMIKYILN